MRFKRNFVTIAISFVFILLMLLCCINVAALSYEYFSQDGFGIIFAILMAIGIILIFIGAFFLREKAVLRGIQKENPALIIFEGIVAVALVVLGFCLIMNSGVDAAVWFGVYLAVVFGVCRMIGGRLCGLLGLVLSLTLSYFALDTGWAVFDREEIICVLCILVPFFVFLLVMKNIIPQFGKSNGVVIFALVVLCALFGAFICLNPLVILLVIGCGLSLLFANIRTVDTTVTKGPFMAGVLVGGSAVFTVIMSFLLEKDLGLLIPDLEPGFDAAVNGGYVLNYFTDKLHNMLSTVMFHAFDFGIFSIILLLFAAMSGVYAIRRKLSEIGPLLLTMIFATIGFVMYSMPESHGFYFTYLVGIFSAYGVYNMLLPEFLAKYEEEDEEEDEDDMFDTGSDDMPIIQTQSPDPVVKEKVADENRESSTSDSEAVSEASVAVDDMATSAEKSSTVNVKSADTGVDSADSNYMEWHVSNEFIRDEENRKERQVEREKQIEVAKEQKEAKDAGKSEEEIQAIADVAEEEKKQSAPGRVVFTGEDMHPSPETVSASIPPMSIKPADPYVAEGRDMSQLEIAGSASDDSLHGTKRPESDTIVLSGYQNSAKMNAPVDILTAINDTVVPEVEIPDVPEVETTEAEVAEANEAADEAAAAVAGVTAEANEAVEELSKAAATFGTENAIDVDIPAAEGPEEGSDEQLDNLLERLDVSDSIKRMSESAREDMADVIEHADDKTEAEVVLKNEDYKFGTGEGEYGDVPTISELEDRWRAEEQLKQTPEEVVPDVVPAEEITSENVTTEETDESDSTLGFDFSGADAEPKGEATTPVSLTPPDDIDPTMDMLVFDSVINTTEEKLDSKPIEPESDEASLDFEQITNPDEMAAEAIQAPADEETFMDIDYTPAEDDALLVEDNSSEVNTDDIEFIQVKPDEYGSIDPVAQEIIPDETAAVEPNMEEIVAEEPEVIETVEPEDEFISFRDMATATVPEEILPTPEPSESVEPVEETVDMSDASDGLEFTDISPDNVEETITETAEAGQPAEPKITKFEPVRIELPDDYKAEKKAPTGPTPVINHTEQSPVYSFTRMDITAPKEDVEQLVIPKPGEEIVSEPEIVEGQESVTISEDVDMPEQVVDTPVMRAYETPKPMAAMLDETLEHEVEEKKDDRFHTEEVVTRTGAGTRSYHRIIIK